MYFQNGEIRLSPFYDLVCTRAIERIDHHLALSVGGQRNPGLITARHWDALARECDVRSRFLHRLLLETAEALLEQLGSLRVLFNEQYGEHPSLQRIERIVKQQCHRVIKNTATLSK